MLLRQKINLIVLATLSGVGIVVLILSGLLIDEVIVRQQTKYFEGVIQNVEADIKTAVEEMEDAKLLDGIGLSNVQIFFLEDKQKDIIDNLRHYRIGATGHFTVIDGDGKVVSDPELAEGSPFDAPYLADLKERGSGTFRISHEGVPKFISFTHADAWDWLIILSIDERELFEEVENFLWISLLVIVVGATIVYYSFNLMFRGTKRRIDATLSFLRDATAGNYEARVEVDHADEIGQVQDGLNTLADAVVRQTDRLRDARNVAEKANLAKSSFLSTMSHEIRTPLNGVLGLAQLLTDTDLNDNQRRKVNTILSSGQTLLAIINDVLDMSKIEAGGITLEEKPFSLKELVSTITTPFQSLADNKGLELIVHTSTTLSNTLKGDSIRLRQILWNLLSNAIKFTDHGRVVLTIENITDPAIAGKQAFKAKDHLLRFSVEDTGPGIAPDRLDLIFDAFTQEDDSITRKHGGTGLGLTIVKELSELMGGSIDVDSELGKGTKFVVYLPFDATSKEEADALSLHNSVDPSEIAEPLNVLVAEDNEVNAVIAQAFLEKFGHTVRHVENGKLAVDAAKEGWADLILMDVHMPEMNGIDATKAIRSSTTAQDLPIVGLTAEAFAERHELFMAAGMNGVLTKPFTEQQLAAALAAHQPVEKRRRHRGETADDVPTDTIRAEASLHGELPSTAEPPPAAPVSDERLPAGDDSKLGELRGQLGAETISILLQEVQSSVQSRMAELRQGLQDADAVRIREAAHAIKGTSSSMFATRVSDLAAAIETSAADVDAVNNMMPAFETAARDALAWWREQESRTNQPLRQ